MVTTMLLTLLLIVTVLLAVTLPLTVMLSLLVTLLLAATVLVVLKLLQDSAREDACATAYPRRLSQLPASLHSFRYRPASCNLSCHIGASHRCRTSSRTHPIGALDTRTHDLAGGECLWLGMHACAHTYRYAMHALSRMRVRRFVSD